jgi:hypothetical protein
MNLVDYLLEKCQHDLSLCKSEMTNFTHIDLLSKAADIIQQIKYDRKREQEITGVKK